MRKIYDCSTIVSQKDWGTLYRENIDMMINAYGKVNIPIHYEKKIKEYININMNINLLYNRPQVIWHGDFHVGNLIITPQNEIGVIHFDKCAVGDCWEEFRGIVWAARLSTQFAKGQVDGYFSGIVQEDFFRLLAVYIGIYALEHLVRSERNQKDERSIETIHSNADFMSKMFDNFKTYIPNWYR